MKVIKEHIDVSGWSFMWWRDRWEHRDYRNGAILTVTLTPLSGRRVRCHIVIGGGDRSRVHAVAANVTGSSRRAAFRAAWAQLHHSHAVRWEVR